jgi:hypothetical protein
VDRLLGVMGDRTSMVEVITPQVGPNMQAQLPHMGDASLFNLVTAMVAAATPGVAGDLVVRIPRKVSDRWEVHWRSAPFE